MIEELAGSPRLTVTQEGTTAVRFFRVSWDRWPSFVRELVGEYQLVGDQWVFREPQPFPGMPNLVVERVEIKPFEPALPDLQSFFQSDRDLNRYDQSGAHVTVWYGNPFEKDVKISTKLPKIPKGTYLTYESTFSLEYVATAARIWRWDLPGQETPLLADNAPGLVVPNTLIKLTWHRVAYPPWDAIRHLRGHVNASVFMNNPPETVLFVGAKIKREFHFFQLGGFWKVEYHFLQTARFLKDGTPAGWNHCFKDDPVQGEYWIRVVDTQGNPPYPLGDFSQLFSFGVP